MFEDLLESRAFRRADTLEKYSVPELGEILFLHLLALYAIRNAKYAKETLNYPLFDGIYFSTTDLANLLSAMKNSEKYLGEKSPTLPILQIKRFLRNGEHGDWNREDCRALFFKLQNILKIKDSTLNKLRRDLVDNDRKYDQLQLLKQLYYKLQKTAYMSDLLGLLHNHLETAD